MQAITDKNTVVGYEANGGFLLNTPVNLSGQQLAALPTRDAILVPLCILLMAKQQTGSVAALLATLPARITYSDRIKNFPTELSQSILAEMQSGKLDNDAAVIKRLFAGQIAAALSIDYTDGVRITLANEEVVHLRGSGNAPELRCYTEAANHQRAQALNQLCMQHMQSWNH